MLLGRGLCDDLSGFHMSPARLIFSTGSLYTNDIAHCFELAAEAGFDGVEVMCDERWSTRDPVYLRRLSERYGMPALVVHTPFSARLPGWRHPADQVARVEQTLQFAEALGAETIVVHLPSKIGRALVQLPGRSAWLPWRSPFGPLKRWFEQTLPDLQRATPIKIAIENMPVRHVLKREIDITWWNTVEEWSRIHQWLTIDTTHWATKGVAPLDAYAAARGRICHVHLSNYDGREHRLPHRGRLDLGALLRTMAADGFAGTVCAELHPDALEFRDDTALRRNLRASAQFCREHLALPQLAAKYGTD
jgi:sugar phosphate isomerase/epimerase